ncbi:hypothetical protein GCM10027341_04060 [Spirosoma knui]
MLIVCGLGITNALGQTARADTGFVTAAIRNATARYEAQNQNKDRLYTGIEYVGYDYRLNGNPFWTSDNWKVGSVAYNGATFDSIPMLYDIVRDVVVIEHPIGYRMTLSSDKLTSFSLFNHAFIRFADSTSRGFRRGFYDLLYDGPTQLLAKRLKSVVIEPTRQNYGRFDEKTVYYLRKEGQYLPVKTKRSLYSVLRDRKKELTTYARKQKIRFKEDPEAAITKLTQYYDQIRQ